MHPFMAVSSALFAVLFLVLVLANLDLVSSLQASTLSFIGQYFSEYLVWIVTIIVVFTVAVGVSPYGRLTLGQDGEKPEFNRFSWFAMLFSAGVGTGILFYGVAEPMLHWQNAPFLDLEGVAPLTPEGGKIALRTTLFHWGFHGWAVYSMVGLSLAYFAFRKGLPLTVRSALYPFIGDRIYGPIGNTIDLLAILSTLFGIAVSLGLGASQMASGLEYLFGYAFTPMSKLGLILFVSTIATISAVSGVSRGIRRLSEMNMWLSIFLISFLLLAGPTAFILTSYFVGTADYFATFLPMGVWVDPNPDDGWQSAWTLFYWGWWISWGPFVGMFMARISRGRSIREYVAGTLLAPTVAGFLWLTVFGATAIDIELNGAGGLVDAVNQDMTQALFTTYELLQVDWATWSVSFLSTVLIVSWFVTSSDSGTLVICTIICTGEKRPPIGLRVIWGTIIALVAGILLLAGGLTALQAASTAIAIPFGAVLILMMLGLGRSLWQTELIKK
ncbi:MAG: choline/glycine/proline betaine transport protein [Woeseiaceae bacterium]|jgi:choline/glycine/proline betaine transport protein